MTAEPTTGAAETQVDEAAQPQVGPQDATQAVDPSNLQSLPEWARKELDQTRKELARRRKADDERQKAEMTEAQRLKQQLDDVTGTNTSLATELRSLKAQSLLRDAGARHPDLLADKLSDEALNGDRKARDAEIADLRKQYPGLFHTSSADGAAGRMSDGVGDLDMNRILRQAAGRGR